MELEYSTGEYLYFECMLWLEPPFLGTIFTAFTRYFYMLADLENTSTYMYTVLSYHRATVEAYVLTCVVLFHILYISKTILWTSTYSPITRRAFYQNRHDGKV